MYQLLTSKADHFPQPKHVTDEEWVDMQALLVLTEGEPTGTLTPDQVALLQSLTGEEVPEEPRDAMDVDGDLEDPGQLRDHCSRPPATQGARLPRLLATHELAAGQSSGGAWRRSSRTTPTTAKTCTRSCKTTRRTTAGCSRASTA